MNDFEKKQATAIINKLRQGFQNHVDYYKTHYCDTDGEIDGKNISLDALAQLDVIQNLVGLRPDAATVSTLREGSKISKKFNDGLIDFKDKLQEIHTSLVDGFSRYDIEDKKIKQYFIETLKTAGEEFNVFYEKYYNQLDVSEIVLEKFYKSIGGKIC